MIGHCRRCGLDPSSDHGTRAHDEEANAVRDAQREAENERAAKQGAAPPPKQTKDRAERGAQQIKQGTQRRGRMRHMCLLRQ